ncbi:hypothetical protein, partial [Aromatoleum bremense]|uniref:hypothetical protein n=1 Tax=Aromatoleum bremense TaxID=76115 RepID=UPI001B7D1903
AGGLVVAARPALGLRLVDAEIAQSAHCRSALWRPVTKTIGECRLQAVDAFQKAECAPFFEAILMAGHIGLEKKRLNCEEEVLKSFVT